MLRIDMTIDKFTVNPYQSSMLYFFSFNLDIYQRHYHTNIVFIEINKINIKHAPIYIRSGSFITLLKLKKQEKSYTNRS
jgi:hypothetical protein